MPYLVWCPERGHTGPNDGIEFDVFCAEDAAIAWAECEDQKSADHWIVGGQTPVVFVYNSMNHTNYRFQISGEIKSVYSVEGLGCF